MESVRRRGVGLGLGWRGCSMWILPCLSHLFIFNQKLQVSSLYPVWNEADALYLADWRWRVRPLPILRPGMGGLRRRGRQIILWSLSRGGRKGGRSVGCWISCRYISRLSRRSKAEMCIKYIDYYHVLITKFIEFHDPIMQPPSSSPQYLAPKAVSAPHCPPPSP